MEVSVKLEQIFRDIFDDEKIVLRDDMTSDDIEDWDSLMHVQLILAIEQNFQVKFKTSEIAKIENVGQFKEALSSKVGHK